MDAVDGVDADVGVGETALYIESADSSNMYASAGISIADMILNREK